MTVVFWKYVWTCFLADKASIIAFSVLFLTAGIKTAPVPGPPWFAWDWHTAYTWWYDWIHQFFNLPNNRLAIITPPAPPATPAEQEASATLPSAAATLPTVASLAARYTLGNKK